MATSPTWLWKPLWSRAVAARLLYNTLFAGWLLLLMAAVHSLTYLSLSEKELYLGSFLLLGFNFLSGLLLVALQLLLSSHQQPVVASPTRAAV